MPCKPNLKILTTLPTAHWNQDSNYVLPLLIANNSSLKPILVLIIFLQNYTGKVTYHPPIHVNDHMEPLGYHPYNPKRLYAIFYGINIGINMDTYMPSFICIIADVYKNGNRSCKGISNLYALAH